MTATTARTIALTLTIPGTPAYAWSPNSRAHWRVKHQESEAVKWAVRLAWREAMQRDPDLRPMHGPVRLIWGINLAKRRKFMDRTNATATLKIHEDALVELGIIDGDTPDIVTDIKIHQFLYTEHRIAEGEIEVTIMEATHP